jgi:hypothetical protein
MKFDQFARLPAEGKHAAHQRIRHYRHALNVRAEIGRQSQSHPKQNWAKRRKLEKP